MRVIRKRFAEGAGEAEGLVVIIDVFRAFSCQPLFFQFGAARVILEADASIATAMKRQHPEIVLVGEVDEIPLEGADLGNSPVEIILKGEVFFRNKTVVHRSTAGVTGAARALDHVDEVILGSFMTARAIAGFIKSRNPERVTLVAMGSRATQQAPEDEACAEYLEHLLAGEPYDYLATLKEIVFQPTAQKFIQGGNSYLPREDALFCLQRNLFDFVLVARRQGNTLRVAKIDQGSSR